MKNRLKKEGNESVTNCNQLKLPSSDGKYYKTDVADTEQLFRLWDIRIIGLINVLIELEEKTGQKVVTSLNAKDVLQLKEEKNTDNESDVFLER